MLTILPLELVLAILNQCDFHTAFNLRITCRHFHQLITIIDLARRATDEIVKNRAAFKVEGPPLLVAHIVVLLHAKGRDVGLTGGNGQNPRLDPAYQVLIYAINRGSIPAVDILIDAGVGFEPDCDLHRELTPLVTAVLTGNASMVKILVKAGAKLDRLFTGSGWPQQYHTALEVALRTRVPETDEIVPALIGGQHTLCLTGIILDEDVEALELYFRYTTRKANAMPRSFIKAIKEGKTEIVKSFIAHGADVNTTSNWEKPMQAAMDGGFLEIMRMLREAGAERPELGDRCLDYKYRVFDYLVETETYTKEEYHQALLEVVKQWGRAPKSGRSRYQHMVNKLVNKGANPTYRQPENGYHRDCAVCVSAKSGNLALLKIFAEVGTDVAQCFDSEHCDAFKEAAYEGHSDVVHWFLEIRSDVEQQTLSKALKAVMRFEWSAERTNIVRMLIEAGADVNYEPTDKKDRYSWDAAPLILAGQYCKSSEAFQCLLDAGVDIGRYGEEALRQAVSSENIEAIKLLLEAGVDANCRLNVRETEQTPLIIAFSRYSRSVRQICALLVEHGADINRDLTTLLQMSGSDAAKYLALAESGVDLREHLDEKDVVDILCREGTTHYELDASVDRLQVLLDYDVDVLPMLKRAVKNASNEENKKKAESVLRWVTKAIADLKKREKEVEERLAAKAKGKRGTKKAATPKANAPKPKPKPKPTVKNSRAVRGKTKALEVRIKG